MSSHLCAHNQSADHTAPDDDRLQHVEAVEGGNEGVLHFLVVPDGLLEVAPLQLLIAEVLHGFVVQQCVCCLGALGIVQPVQVPAAALVVLRVLMWHPSNACKYDVQLPIVMHRLGECILQCAVHDSNMNSLQIKCMIAYCRQGCQRLSACRQCRHCAFICWADALHLTIWQNSRQSPAQEGSLPSEVAPPFCEVDGDRDVADKRHKHDDCNPWLQRCRQVHTGSSNVKDLWADVEDDSGQDALDGVGASVHDACELACLSVQVEVEVQVQRVHKDIKTDAPAAYNKTPSSSQTKCLCTETDKTDAHAEYQKSQLSLKT